MKEATERTLEILQNKIDRKYESTRSANAAAIADIVNEAVRLEDSLVDIHAIDVYANGRVFLDFESDPLALNRHSLRQLADKVGAPASTVSQLGFGVHGWERNLSAHILKEFISYGRHIHPVLIRSFEGNCRAVLSSSYKRYDSASLVTSFIKEVQSSGARINGAFHSLTKSYISAIIPQVREIETPNNGKVHVVAGVEFRNSDYGAGYAADIRVFCMNVVCLNGMISQRTMKKVHLGKRMTDASVFSQATIDAETRALSLAMSDVVRYGFSESSQREITNKIAEASAQEVDAEAEVKKLESSSKLTKKAGQELRELLMAGEQEDGLQGTMTKWKLAQGISALVRPGRGDDLQVDQRKDLEELAGKMVFS